MKTIATFTKPEEAHLLRIRLEAAGIQAYLQDENMIQMDLLASNAIGGVRVQVVDEDLEPAQKILEERSRLETNPDLPPDAEAIECCACHALIPPGQTRCTSCGWSYEDDTGEPEAE